jgi:hypothetical protein
MIYSINQKDRPFLSTKLMASLFHLDGSERLTAVIPVATT